MPGQTQRAAATRSQGGVTPSGVRNGRDKRGGSHDQSDEPPAKRVAVETDHTESWPRGSHGAEPEARTGTRTDETDALTNTRTDTLTVRPTASGRGASDSHPGDSDDSGNDLDAPPVVQEQCRRTDGGVHKERASAVRPSVEGLSVSDIRKVLHAIRTEMASTGYVDCRREIKPGYTVLAFAFDPQTGKANKRQEKYNRNNTT